MKRDEREEWFAGRDVLITGAGGFIGSALAKGLAQVQVRSLTLLDSSEQNLFELERRTEFANVKWTLGSVADRELVRELLDHLRTPVILHAAAYKHVGFLERQLRPAVLNNTLATHWLAVDAADRAAPMVLVSTDKAVRPHSVMGISKRAAELLSTPYGAAAVRLGNVWESTGSVVPLLREQIASGVPMRVTHSDAARYFFSVDEAVDAILGAVRVRGRVVVPPFREPRRIVDVARSLSAEIPIEFTGLRPGEKLTEEFLYPDETLVDSVVEGRSLTRYFANVYAVRMGEALLARDGRALLDVLCELEPAYSPSELCGQ